MFVHFEVAHPAPAVALVTLRPAPGAKVFQFSQAVLAELLQVMEVLEADAALKVVIFTGTGRVFAAGGDIAEMRGLIDSAEPVESGTQFAAAGQTVMDRIERSRLISIAAFNGAAVGGGCELGLACDWRMAAQGIKLGQPEINLGLIPGWGGCRRLLRLVQVARAKYLIFTGELITSETALEWGLVQQVTPAQELLQEALAVATKITSRSGSVLRACKEAISAGLLEEDRAAQMVERSHFGQCFNTADTREGLSAFLEKRPPVFR